MKSTGTQSNFTLTMRNFPGKAKTKLSCSTFSENVTGIFHVMCTDVCASSTKASINVNKTFSTIAVTQYNFFWNKMFWCPSLNMLMNDETYDSAVRVRFENDTRCDVSPLSSNLHFLTYDVAVKTRFR